MKITRKKLRKLILEAHFDTSTGQSLSVQGDKILARQAGMEGHLSNIANKLDSLELSVIAFSERHMEQPQYERLSNQTKEGPLLAYQLIKKLRNFIDIYKTK